MKINTINIPAGESVTLATDAVSNGQYVRFIPGGSAYTPVDIAASASVVLGPFNESRDYNLVANAGDITVAYNGADGNYTAVDEALTVKTTDDITALVPLAETNIAEIADDATGAAIATAVNGILGILVTAGLMTAPE